MTPAEKLGWKVGDKFVLTETAKQRPVGFIRDCIGTSPDAVFTLVEDTGDNCILFTTDECDYKHGPGDTPGAYIHIILLTPKLEA